MKFKNIFPRIRHEVETFYDKLSFDTQIKLQKLGNLGWGIAFFTVSIPMLLSGCKKDCKLADVSNFRIEESGNKKNPCYYVLEGITLDPKSIDDIKNLESRIRDAQSMQDAVMYGTAFKYADIKTVRIDFGGAIVTTPENFPVWRGFGQLASKFNGISITVNQRGQGVCPRDDKTPLDHSEWKQWWFNATTPLQLSINPWSGARWLVDDKEAFKRDGCDPDQLSVPMKDTVRYTIESIPWFQNNSSAINLRINEAKQTGREYFIIKLGDNLLVPGAQKNAVAEIMDFGRDKARYPDSLVAFGTNGYGVGPSHAGITVSYQEWDADWNGLRLIANPNNGEKFVASCKDTADFRAGGQNPGVFVVDNGPCTGSDTIRISSEAALIGAPGSIAQSISKPLNKTYVQFSGNFSVNNGAAWESSATQVLDYIDNQSVIYVPGTGKIKAGSDSTHVIDMTVLKRLDQEGLLQSNSHAGNNFFYHPGFTSSTVTQIPAGQIMRTDKLQSSAGGDISNPVPKVFEANTPGGISTAGFVTLYDAGWGHDIELQVTAAGAYLNRVGDKFLGMLESPAGPAIPAAPFKVVSATNPILAQYTSSNAATVPTGLNNTTYEFDGGNYSGNKLLASLRKARAEAGSTVYPWRVSISSNIAPTFYSNDPTVIEDTSGRFYFDWTDVLEHRDANNGKFGFSNAVAYLTDMTVVNNYINMVAVQGKDPSEFFAQFGMVTTNVIGIGIMPAGKQVFQPAAPGSLQGFAKGSKSAAAVPAKTYNTSKTGVVKWKQSRAREVIRSGR